MILYVRLIDKSRWVDCNSLEDLCGEAITEDWRCVDNDWSVYQFDGLISNLKKNDLLNKIVLRMVADNVKKTHNGVDLLVLDDSFIKDIQSNIRPDKTPKLDSYHCNIDNITYGKIIKAIRYTSKYYNNRVISYSINEIHNLILQASPDFLDHYRAYAKKREGRIEQINKAFMVSL